MRYHLRTLMIAVTLAACASAYARMYFVLTIAAARENHSIIRYYRHRWQAVAFMPAAVADSLLRRQSIKTRGINPIIYQVDSPSKDNRP